MARPNWAGQITSPEIVEALRTRFPALATPRKEDICYATQNRQDAVKNLLEKCDVLLVVGSRTSSNSNRLRELADRAGMPGYLIDGPDDLAEHYRAAAGLADAMGDVPCVVLALAVHNGQAHSVVPAVQNLLLAARALGIGSVPTTLHETVMARVRTLFAIPDDVAFHFCIPLGYPRGAFGPTNRKPTAETTFLDRWDAPVPWA